MATTKTIMEITREYLEKNGYDGLVGLDGECGCELDDLFPCEFEGVGDCQAGYKVACTGGDHCDGDCDWHIAAEKP